MMHGQKNIKMNDFV